MGWQIAACVLFLVFVSMVVLSTFLYLKLRGSNDQLDRARDSIDRYINSSAIDRKEFDRLKREVREVFRHYKFYRKGTVIFPVRHPENHVEMKRTAIILECLDESDDDSLMGGYALGGYNL